MSCDERMKGKSGGGYVMADKICSSADKVLEVFLENAPMDTSHHRMVKQQNNVVDCALMVHADCLRQNQKECVEQMRIRLRAEIS